jgi:hypothetical protein
MDLCVTSSDAEENILWRNDSTGGNHWLTLDLRGSCSNRSAVGTLVEVWTDLGETVLGPTADPPAGEGWFYLVRDTSPGACF